MNKYPVENAVIIYEMNEDGELVEVPNVDYVEPIETLRGINPGLELQVRPCLLTEHHGDWPTAVQDMLALSRIFPQYVFELWQETPEEADDNVFNITYFHNSHIQVVAVVSIPTPFSADKFEYVEVI